MHRFIICGLVLLTAWASPLRATVLIPTIESWGINGSGSQVYLPGSSISISVSVSATRTDPANNNSQVVNIYVSKVNNSIISPAAKIGMVTCSIPGGNIGGGPVVTQPFTLPTTFGGTSFTAGTYYIVFSAVGSAGSSVESSSFTIGVPDISLQSPGGTNLTNGSSTVSFGDTAVGQKLSVDFVIQNPGSGSLTNINPTLSGANAADFSFTSLPATSLTPGSTTSVRVQFSPSAAGVRSASLSIGSSVTGSKNPFVVALSGTGDASPTATTEVATNVTDTSAVLNGTVNANGTATTTSFEYGATSSYGSSISSVPSSVTGTTATAVAATLTGLTPNTVLHYRVDAASNGGMVSGTDQVLTTLPGTTDVPTLSEWGMVALTVLMLLAGSSRLFWPVKNQ